MITMDKQYRYRNGEPARVLCVDRPNDWSVVSMSDTGVLHLHQNDGYSRRMKTAHFCDLIEVVPLWRGELWIHDSNVASINKMPQGEGAWRKINAVEVRKDEL